MSFFSKLFETPPTVEAYVAEKGRCNKITNTLSFVVQNLQKTAAKSDNRIENCEISNTLCSILEAILLHQHRGNKTSFWNFVIKYTHKNTIDELKQESALQSEIGLCRGWVRKALNQNLFESYLSTIIADSKSLKKNYYNAAFLRDFDQISIAQTHIQYITSVIFSLPVDVPLLNTWPQTTLILAGHVTGDFVLSLLAGPQFESTKLDDSKSDEIVVEVAKSKPKKLKKTKPSTQSEASPEGYSTSNISLQSSNSSSDAKFSSRDGAKRFSIEKELTGEDSLKDVINPKDISVRHTQFYSNIDLNPPDSTNFDSLPDNCSLSNNEKSNDKRNYEERDTSICPKSDLKGRTSERGDEPEMNAVETEITMEDNSIYDSNYLIGNSLNRQLDRMALMFKDKSTMSKESEIHRNHSSSSVSSSSQDIEEAYEDKTNSEICNNLPGALLPEKDFEIIIKDDGLVCNREDFYCQKSIMDQLQTEKGLDSQKFICKGCNRNIGLIYGEHKVCWFDKAYYCTECQGDDEYYIPSRILYNWDFNKYPVSKRNLQFIKMVESEGILNILKTSSELYSISDGLRSLRTTRQRLSFCKDYLLNCSLSVRENFRKAAWPKEYYYYDIDTYSLSDLLSLATSDALERKLYDLYTYAKKHIFECVLCRQKGFYCEICRSNEILFPFELDRVLKCTFCGSIFHRYCKSSSSSCPKCLRLQQRRSKEDNYALAPF